MRVLLLFSLSSAPVLYILTLASFLNFVHIFVAYILLNNVSRKYAGWTMTMYSVGVTSTYHIKRMLINYGNWDTDVTQLFMIQVISMSYLGWDYTDGANPESKSRTRLPKLPSFIEYFAAIICPTQVLAGPSSHFTDFYNYVYSKSEYAEKFETSYTGFKRILTAIIWLAIYSLIRVYYPYEMFFTKEFYEANFFSRLNIFMVIGLGVKARYYSPFKFAEAAVIFSGQAFNGYDKETKQPKFDKISMINIYCTELSVFLRSIIEEWHKPVQQWLKECVHSRIREESKRKYFVTFFMSALWHGFYPLYFYSFFYYSIGTINFNYIYKLFITHKFLRTPLIYIAESYYL